MVEDEMMAPVNGVPDRTASRMRVSPIPNANPHKIAQKNPMSETRPLSSGLDGSGALGLGARGSVPPPLHYATFRSGRGEGAAGKFELTSFHALLPSRGLDCHAGRRV